MLKSTVKVHACMFDSHLRKGQKLTFNNLSQTPVKNYLKHLSSNTIFFQKYDIILKGITRFVFIYLIIKKMKKRQPIKLKITIFPL